MLNVDARLILSFFLQYLFQYRLLLSLDSSLLPPRCLDEEELSEFKIDRGGHFVLATSIPS